jgi:diguanylate cyclase (GGDEF)-like protein
MLSRTNSSKHCHASPYHHSLQGLKIWLLCCLLLCLAMSSGQASSTSTLLNPATVNPATVNPATVNPATVNPATIQPATPASTVPQDEISKHKTHFIVAVGQDSFPYQFATNQGKADGLLVDIWSLWAQKNGYSLEFELAPWINTLEQVQNAKVDFHAGMAITHQRQQTYHLGEPVVSIQAGIFIHQQLSGIYSINDLKSYVIGIVEGSSHRLTLEGLLPGAKLRTFRTRDALYRAALDGEVKVFAGLSRIDSRHHEFDQLSKSFPLYKKITYQNYQMAFATSRSGVGETIAEQLQKGLAKLTAAEIQTLERKWLGVGAQSDVIVIATPSDMAPYMSVSAEGEPIGLIVDVWKKWAEKTGREVVFLSDNSDVSMQNLGSKKADIHAGTIDGSINNELFPHAHHMYSYYSKIYYPLDEDDQHVTEQNINQSKLGVLTSDPVKKELHKRYRDITLVEFDNLQAMINASLNHQISGFVAGKETIKVHLIKSNQQTRFGTLENVQFESKLYSLVRKDNKALVSEIKEGFSLIDIKELQGIEQAWIESSDPQYFSTFKNKVTLSEAQRSWLQRYRVIRLGALNNWPPIEFANEQGELAGVTADLMAIIEKRAQVSIKVELFSEWSALLDAFKAGKIDMVASMETTAARETYAAFTEGYWPQHWALILPNTESDIHNVAELKGKRLAVVKGYQLIPYIHENFPQVILQVVPDSKSGFAAIRSGQADAFIDGMVVAASELKEGEYRDLSLSLVDDIAPAMERIGIRKDWQPLVDILNTVILTITDTEKKQILEKWFEIKIESGVDKEKVFQFGALVVVIFAFILIWNRRLQSEITLRRAIEVKIKHMATHDELTQLPNRALLRDRLNTAIPSHARHHELLALLFIDLDGFKDINDTYGHDVGDELLIQLADRFKGSIRKTDTIARFGGDEFVVLLTSLHHRDEAAEVCEKLLSIIQEPFCLSRCTAGVGASVGIAMYPDDGTTDTDLMKVADTLMYEVKAAGKNDYKFAEFDEAVAAGKRAVETA